MTIKDTSSYLDAYRKKIATPPESRERNLEALRERAAKETELAEPPRVRRAAALLGIKSKLVVAVIATAGLGAVAVGTAVIDHDDDPAATSEPLAVPSKAAAAPEQTSRSQALPSVHTAPPVVDEQPQGARTSEAPPNHPPPKAKRSTPAPAPAPQIDVLEEELQLMKEARAHLEAERYDAANDLLRSHAKRFPRGALSEERAAWLAIVACKRGVGQATAAARAFVLAHPRSPLLAKVRKQCDLP